MLTQKTKIKNGMGIKGVQNFVMKGNYNQALEMLDILIKKIDQNSKALLYKLDLLRIVGRTTDIDKTITTFLTRYPNDTLVNERYGDILKADGKKDQAERYYQKAFANAQNKNVSKRLEMKISN
jgi:predicted negative regulator of RcsB-dependent stress response